MKNKILRNFWTKITAVVTIEKSTSVSTTKFAVKMLFGKTEFIIGIEKILKICNLYLKAGYKLQRSKAAI